MYFKLLYSSRSQSWLQDFQKVKIECMLFVPNVFFAHPLKHLGSCQFPGQMVRYQLAPLQKTTPQTGQFLFRKSLETKAKQVQVQIQYMLRDALKVHFQTQLFTSFTGLIDSINFISLALWLYSCDSFSNAQRFNTGTDFTLRLVCMLFFC